MTPRSLVRFVYIMGLVIQSTVFAGNPEVEAARADRAAHFPESDWNYIYYLTTRPHVGKEALDLERAFKLAIASDTIQPVIERSVPVKVATGLFRIDLRDLHWRSEDFVGIIKTRYPYYAQAEADHFPLIRADWLLVEISDRQESDSYDRLLFGGDKLPKTKDDVLKFFKVVQDQQLTFGLIEGQSEVSVQGRRRIESLPIPRGYAWVTSDVLKLDNKRDPVEHAEGGSPFDGQEGIIGFPKLSTTSGARGNLQWYWLNNKDGVLVNRAPVDLVRDSSHFRGYDEIRRPGSCIQCHSDGLNRFKRNEFRQRLHDGVKVFAGYEQQQDLERFNLSDLKTEVGRANDDFQTMVIHACGGGELAGIPIAQPGMPAIPARMLTSADVSNSFRLAINRYDAPLNLEQTATELGIPVAEWTKALVANTDIPAGLAGLPHNNTIPRAGWEEVYGQAYQATHGGIPIKRAAIQPVKPEEKAAEVKAGGK